MNSYVVLWVLMQATDLKTQQSGFPMAVFTTEQACAMASQKDEPESRGWSSLSWVPHHMGQYVAYNTVCVRTVLDPK